MRPLLVCAYSIVAVLGLSFMISCLDATSMEEEEILPICQKKSILSPSGPDILLVSTLDGKLTAIDPKNQGKTLWSVSTGPGSMLSSTISQLELMNNAKHVRLIPSLGGGLYKFDGEVIEPIPLSAEELLRTSFKFADHTVMTGGKESRVYGIQVSSGRIKYECTMEGCFGPSGETLSASADEDLDDIIIVKRETQVVRAVEPKSGSEKWNFSVSTHHLTFQPGIEDICNTTDEDEILDDMEDLKAVVPEGIICQVDKEKPDIIKWRQTFNSPIVHAWRLEKGHLIPINLFSNSHLPSSQEASSSSSESLKSDPSLYIGTYKQQLYIQENDFQLDKLQASKEPIYPKVNWKPYLISADSRTTVINHGSKPSQADLPMLTYDPGTAKSTALTVFNQGGNAEYPYDSGLYFYPEEPTLEVDLIQEMKSNITEEDEETKDETIEEIQRPLEENEMPNPAVQFVFVSMWYWWQEIVLISLLTGIAMNYIFIRPYIENMRTRFQRKIGEITARSRRPNQVVFVPYEVQVEVPVPKTPETASTDTTKTTFSRSISGYSSAGEFVSRYETDYDTVQCLGAGGFGVVFESKNKLDENHYAVKRVRLPSHEEAKKKVMREVKCLAKLDQKNIVRYYSTWLEYPPPGWQEEFDKNIKLVKDNCCLSEGAGESLSLLGSEPTNNPLKPYDKQPRSSTDLNSFHQDDDDSFKVVFEAASESSEDEDEDQKIQIEEDDDESDDCGIVFKEDSKSLKKPAPSRSISIVSMTNSKFWKDISEEVETEEECMDALVWDTKSQKPASVYLYIVMQLCQKESLRSWLRINESRNRLHCLDIFNQICTGVEYVHSQGVIHRDLKPSNIFFANDGTIKIGDFGLATATGNNANAEPEMTQDGIGNVLNDPGDKMEGHTEEVGTELYMSPEQLEKKPYSNKVDIYSLGLILFELLVPFSTQMERIQTLMNLRKTKFPSDFMAKEAEYTLVKAMLEHDPDERPEALDVLDSDLMTKAQAEFEKIVNSGDAADQGFAASSWGSSTAQQQRRRRKHLSSGGSNHSSQ